MDIHARLATLIAALGETPVSFSEKLGIQRSSVSHLLSARNKPSVDFLEKLLAVYPSVNLGWLIAGLGKIWVEAENRAPESLTINTDTVMEDISAPASEPEPVQHIEKELTKNRMPSKVLLFYADGSFEVFYPS